MRIQPELYEWMELWDEIRSYRLRMILLFFIFFPFENLVFRNSDLCCSMFILYYLVLSFTIIWKVRFLDSSYILDYLKTFWRLNLDIFHFVLSVLKILFKKKLRRAQKFHFHIPKDRRAFLSNSTIAPSFYSRVFSRSNRSNAHFSHILPF